MSALNEQQVMGQATIKQIRSGDPDLFVKDRVPHGCGTRAYMDVFTACLEQTDRGRQADNQQFRLSGLFDASFG